jgi:hypothetical protein
VRKIFCYYFFGAEKISFGPFLDRNRSCVAFEHVSVKRRTNAFFRYWKHHSKYLVYSSTEIKNSSILYIPFKNTKRQNTSKYGFDLKSVNKFKLLWGMFRGQNNNNLKGKRINI